MKDNFIPKKMIQCGIPNYGECPECHRLCKEQYPEFIVMYCPSCGTPVDFSNIQKETINQPQHNRTVISDTDKHKLIEKLKELFIRRKKH